MRRVPWSRSVLFAIFGIAGTMTVLNAIKPLHMDDTTYYSYATQIATHPGDPYGGEISIYWTPPRTGMNVLVPVFLPYFWSLAYQVHGDNTFLCKLWLFPFALMLVGGTWGLARRFARGLEPVVTLLVAFSPAILPSMNFMLDIPTLSLSVFALFIFTHACDLKSFRLAILAGAVAGLAINTKWTGIVVPGVLGLYALTHRRVTLGIVAGMVAAAIFISWETLIWFEYGASHFLLHKEKKVTPLMDRINGIKALLAILGGVCPAVLLLGLNGLRRQRYALVMTVLIVLALVGLAVGVPSPPIFLTLGVLLFINMITVSVVLLRRRQGPRHWRGNADSVFLVLWLGLEIVGVFVLSPYSAVRRYVGVVVVMTLLAGRMASRRCRSRSARKSVRWIAMAGIALGLLYYGVDFHEARVEKTAAETSSREALALAKPGETVWFAGRWGFRHYARQAGLKHVVLGREELKRGDILVVHDNKLSTEPNIFLDPTQLDEILTLKYDDNSSFPYRTVPSYYAGKEPLDRQVGPRFVVHVYRVTNAFTPLGLIPREYFPKDQAVGATMVKPLKK